MTKLLASLCIALCIVSSATARLAAIHEVQPALLDVVHAIWLNGPTHSSKLGSYWPTSFGDGAGIAGAKCAGRADARYTGYSDAGQYCEKASSALDDDAQLLIHSGRLGVVVDAGGLAAATSNNTRNLLPKLGIVPPQASAGTPREIYNALSNSTTDVTLTLTGCASSSDNAIYTLGAANDAFVSTGLVRQGHAVTQVTLSRLEFHSALSGEVFGSCSSLAPSCTSENPDNANCNQNYKTPATSNICADPAFPECRGFQQSVAWGKCWNVSAFTSNNLWGELSVWGDSIAFELAWDAAFDLPAGCAGSVNVSLLNGAHASSADASNPGRISLVLTSPTAGSLERAQTSADPIQVTSVTGTVLSRAATHDVFLEVPTNTPKCGYDTACASKPLTLIDVVLRNPSATDHQTLRLSFSRNFETRDTELSQSRPAAEITGLSAQLWDTTSRQPSGIPMQISKNWHSGSTTDFWAGFDGLWWTANALLRLPPDTEVLLSMALSYEMYGGVRAWSHAQLSVVGYSNKWLWEQAALGTGGENICFDPLGTHTRAFITDVRPTLFDGKWKENVGGGDFMQLFGADGRLQYLRAMDPQLHVSGPCLSDAEYKSTTLDGAISQHVRIRGARTDDLVRVFVDIRVEAMAETPFSRLFFFQFGSETNSYNARFERLVWGSNGSEPTELLRTCQASRSDQLRKIYSEPSLPFREKMNGTAPWWFAFDKVSHTPSYAGSSMLVGDRGVVIRSFEGRLGGEAQRAPSFSVLCDKLELGTPAGVKTLLQGDFVKISLELLVLPRDGAEFESALANSNSRTLAELVGMPSTAERVQAQADRGELGVVQKRGVRSVEEHYPVHVTAESSDHVMFEIEGRALGFVPIVISGLLSPFIPAGHGLWLRCESEQGGNHNFTRLEQGLAGQNEFWQANLDRTTGEYSLVFNIELEPNASKTTVAFGSDPVTWEPAWERTSSSSSTTTLAPTSSSSSPTPEPRISTTSLAEAVGWAARKFAACNLSSGWDTWDNLVEGEYETGGLGRLMNESYYEVWLCMRGHECAARGAFCFVFNEQTLQFLPWFHNLPKP